MSGVPNVITLGTILSDIKTESLRLRLTRTEKEVFERAAHIEGIDVSALIRGGARKEALRILTAAGEENPFYVPNKKPKKAK